MKTFVHQLPRLSQRISVLGIIASFCLMSLINLCSRDALAQNDVGSVVGFVTDQSGAVVPGAKVTITNEGTGERRNVTTDAQGHYSVPNLPPAIYTMTAEAHGFQTFSSVHNRLASNNTVEISAKLTVGQQTDGHGNGHSRCPGDAVCGHSKRSDGNPDSERGAERA
jgi:hypothetical protein